VSDINLGIQKNHTIMKCPTCEKVIVEGWNYCPICGSQFIENPTEYFVSEKNFLNLKGEHVKIIQNNFESVKSIKILPLFKPKRIRSRLGDNAHINLFQSQSTSALCLSPNLIEWVLQVARMVGYYMVHTPARSTGVKQTLELMKKKGVESLPTDKLIVKLTERMWKSHGLGELMSVKAVKDWVQMDIRDVGCSIKAYGSKYCTLTAALCGQAEALTDKVWSGRLLKCQHLGDDYCSVRIHPGSENFVESQVSVQEYQDLIKDILNSIASRKFHYPREKLGEEFHISMHQIFNYLMVSSSPGHTILTKHSGVMIGKGLSEKIMIKGENEALTYLKELFQYLRAGILHDPVEKGDRLLLRMDESVYASGVNNIHMKLDVFLAGIIEGMLKQATGEKWQVDEVKCLANGDEWCEFSCRKK